MIRVVAARSDDLEDILGLLRSVDLPETGVAEAIERFVLIRDGGGLAGCCGLELHGEHGLLRSLAVASVRVNENETPGLII